MSPRAYESKARRTSSTFCSDKRSDPSAVLDSRRLLEAVVAPEELVADAHRGHAGHSAGDRVIRRFLEPVLDRFTLDRLGNAATITTSGFPKGGNGVIILNAELRVNVTPSIQAVGFLDGGNVYPQASDVDVTDMRGAYGFGARYRSPVGPIRIDLGFKMNRLELVAGTRERGNVLHISLGQAF